MTNKIEISRELLPCPLCGSSDVSLAWDVYDTDRGRRTQSQIRCLGCRILTKTFRSHAEARAYWNNRAAPAVERQVEIAGYATSSSRGYGSWLFPTEQSAKPHLKTALGGRPMAADVVPLYTSPPAPVALTIPDECPHLIVFDDTERENMLFGGAGARLAALKTWEKISMSWNAHLFVRVERNSRDDRYPSAQAAPVAVVLPDRMVVPDVHCPERINAQGWNACLDKVKEMNQSAVDPLTTVDIADADARGYRSGRESVVVDMTGRDFNKPGDLLLAIQESGATVKS